MQTIDLQSQILQKFCHLHQHNTSLDNVYSECVGRYQVPLSVIDLRLNDISFAELANADAGLYQLDCVDENNFFNFIQNCKQDKLLSAYHVIFDRGLLTTIAEMQFTARIGINLNLDDNDLIERLFSPQKAIVIQILPENVMEVMALADQHNVGDELSLIGQTIETPNGGGGLDNLTIITPQYQGDNALSFTRGELQQAWHTVNPNVPNELVQQELALINDPNHHGLITIANYEFDKQIEQPYINARNEQGNPLPKVAILYNQLTDSYLNLKYGFECVGFVVVAITVQDVLDNIVHLRDFDGLVVADYHSDQLTQIYDNDAVRMQFVQFFHRPNTFTLAVGSGCQLISQLKQLIPHADHFPSFITNRSNQFEQRTINVRIEQSKSLLFKGMLGSVIPAVVATDCGRMDIDEAQLQEMVWSGYLVVRCVDSHSQITEQYPLNPTGTLGGVMGVTSNYGRVTLLTVQPEFGIRDKCGNDGAWLRMFRNAMAFLQ